MTVRPFTKTSSTLISKYACTRSGSSLSVPVSGSEVVKRVWGAFSGKLLMLESGIGLGRLIWKVSVDGVQVRVV